MENCLFAANLPQSLNNYELTIALYLVFSKFGKITIVKASRDSAQRPFGFVEFNSTSGCVEAINENETNGIIIGGRKVRLEMARNTTKLFIELPDSNAFKSLNLINSIIPKLNPIIIPNSNAFIIKLDSSIDQERVISQIQAEHPDWLIQIRSDQFSYSSLYSYSVAESAQRQSGLFQLRIPENGVLPVAPATLAKIHSFSPCLQYSATPLRSAACLSLAPLNINRLYEDWYHDRDEEISCKDPLLARDAANNLSPPLGDWDGDVFLGRLDNQKVTIQNLLEIGREFGQITFLRLCNRSIIREDRVPVDSTAFIRFKTGSSAKNFIEKVNGSTWQGRIVKCEKCWISAVRGPTPPIIIPNE